MVWDWKYGDSPRDGRKKRFRKSKNNKKQNQKHARIKACVQTCFGFRSKVGAQGTLDGHVWSKPDGN